MIFFPRKSPQTLDEWLKIATWSLVPSAKNRIRSEIESHYAEAVSAYLLSGSPEPAAHAAALANLGDARAAGRRFRQRHLTLVDVIQIRTLLLLDRRFFSLSIEILLLCLFLLIWAIHPKSDPLPFWFCMAVVLSYSFVGISTTAHSAVLARRAATLANVRRSLLNHLISYSSFAALLLAIFFGQSWNVIHSNTDNPRMDLLLMAILSWLVSYHVIGGLNFLRWRRKLLTAADDWNDFLPRRPAAA